MDSVQTTEKVKARRGSTGPAKPVSHNLNGQRLGRKGRDTRARILAATNELLANSVDVPISLSAVAREASTHAYVPYSKFPVGVATPEIIAAYDVHLKRPDGSATGRTARTSYVIGRDHRIALVYSDMNPNDHVKKTLEAVRALKAARR